MRIAAPTYDKFQEIRIPAGCHSARPYWLSYGKREALRLQFVFTDQARYILPGVDQQDWNKLAGLSFNLFSNHVHSVMVGWRFNPEIDRFELGFYYHVDGNRVIRRDAEGSEVFAVSPVAGMLRVRFEVYDFLGKVETSIETDAGIVRDEVGIRTSRRSRVINTWFGGNRSAPNDIYILRKLIP